MPSRNIRKPYVENGFYHIYNRGVEKRTIFEDPQDYSVFFGYLKDALMPKDEKSLYERLSDESLDWMEKQKIKKMLSLKNFFGEIDLLAYCLMPNHFHLLLKQSRARSIDNLTSSLMTRYAMYFNKKNSRTGPLFQGVYKAVLVESEAQLLHLSRYIHRNPLCLNEGRTHQKLYTSLPEYLLKRKTEWVKPGIILSYFSKTNPRNSYLSFAEEVEDFNLIKDCTLEQD